MVDAFETWAPREIRRLREEADVLQLALDRFVAAHAPQTRRPRAAANAAPTDGQARRSKYEPVFQRFEEASRDAPISYADMERIALETGMPMERHLLRSTVHSQKQIGRAKAVGEGYVWGRQPEPQTEAASPVQEDAAHE